MILFDAIQCFSATRPLLVYQQQELNAADLVKERHLFSRFLHGISGKRVALRIQDALQLSKWLLYLDSLVSQITIIPAENDIHACATTLALSNSEIVITDQPMYALELTVVDLDDTDLTAVSDKTLEYSHDTQWIISTSGTSGSPRLVKHNLDSLCNKIARGANPNNNTWGLLYGVHRFAGLQVLLQSVISGNKLVLTNPDDPLPEKIRMFSQHGVNCLSATPTLWRKILMIDETEKLSLKTVTLGGEIAESNILGSLARRFPTATIRHIYASTEAGAGFSVSDGLPGFPRNYLQNGVNGVSLAMGKHGTLLIKSTSGCYGYIGSHLTIENGYIDTGDLIRVTDGRCYFIGRKNGTINVGGNKVLPEQIEQVLLEVPGVVLATVSARKSSIMGNLIEASVVVDTSMQSHSAFIDQLRDHCKQRMKKYMVPAFFKIINDIQMNATGKLVRHG